MMRHLEFYIGFNWNRPDASESLLLYILLTSNILHRSLLSSSSPLWACIFKQTFIKELKRCPVEFSLKQIKVLFAFRVHIHIPKHIACVLEVSQTHWENFLSHNICKTDFLKNVKTALFTSMFTSVFVCYHHLLHLLQQNSVRPLAGMNHVFRVHMHITSRLWYYNMTDFMDHVCAAQWDAFPKVQWLHTRDDFMRLRIDFY